MLEKANKVTDMYNTVYNNETPFDEYPLMENIELYSDLKQRINYDLTGSKQAEANYKARFTSTLSLPDYCELNDSLACAQHDVRMAEILLERLATFTENFSDEDKVTYELL